MSVQIDFPSNPIAGNTYSYNGSTYTFVKGDPAADGYWSSSIAVSASTEEVDSNQVAINTANIAENAAALENVTSEAAQVEENRVAILGITDVSAQVTTNTNSISSLQDVAVQVTANTTALNSLGDDSVQVGQNATDISNLSTRVSDNETAISNFSAGVDSSVQVEENRVAIAALPTHTISTVEPVAADGEDGDIWFVVT